MFGCTTQSGSYSKIIELIFPEIDSGEGQDVMNDDMDAKLQRKLDKTARVEGSGYGEWNCENY